MAMNSEEAKSYLSGSYQFKVIEIEVYKVVFTPGLISPAAPVLKTPLATSPQK